MAINIHHLASGNGAAESHLNQRVFEVAAIGVPQVVDLRAELETQFEPGRDLLVFHDADELRRVVQAALQDLPLAELTGASARREVLARHTYMHRMKLVLDAVNR